MQLSNKQKSKIIKYFSNNFNENYLKICGDTAVSIIEILFSNSSFSNEELENKLIECIDLNYFDCENVAEDFFIKNDIDYGCENIILNANIARSDAVEYKIINEIDYKFLTNIIFNK